MRTIITSKPRRRFRDSGMNPPLTYSRSEKVVHVSTKLYQQGTALVLIELAGYHSDLDETTIRCHLAVGEVGFIVGGGCGSSTSLTDVRASS